MESNHNWEKISSPTNQSGEHSFVITIQIPRRMTTQYFSFSFDIYIISKIFKNIKLKGQPLFYVPVTARVLSYVFLHALSSLHWDKVKQFSFRNFLNNIITKIFIFVKAPKEIWTLKHLILNQIGLPVTVIDAFNTGYRNWTYTLLVRS